MSPVYNNEYSASATGQLPQMSKKRRLDNDEYQYEHESDYESEDECGLEYEYYDARGEPILSTVIRPKPFKIRRVEKVESDPIMTDLEFRFTNLSTNETCPARFLEDPNVSWDQAVSNHKSWLKDKRDEKIRLESERIKAAQEKKRLDAIVASLPRFSTAMLARMAREKAVQVDVKPKASGKFYGGTGSSSTSRTAWGHKRNGGNTLKRTTTMLAAPGQLSDHAVKNIRDDRYRKLLVNADEEAARVRSSHRLARKEKENDDVEKDEGRVRMKEAVERYNKERVEEAVVKAAMAAEAEETDAQARERERMEATRILVQSKLKENQIEYVERREVESRAVESKPVVVKKKPVAPVTEADRIRAHLYNPVVVAPRLCMSITKGYTCKFGSSCKFSHVKPTKAEVVRVEPQTVRTRLCTSATSNVKCRHGSRCKFAHTPDQLNHMPCRFGNKCKSVRLDPATSIWMNVDPRIVCGFAHAGEDVDRLALCKRLGMKPGLLVVKPKVEVEIPVKEFVKSASSSWAGRI